MICTPEVTSNEPICIIGGSGRIGNKVMSILMNNKLKLSLLITKFTMGKLTSTGIDENHQKFNNNKYYQQLLNTKISEYNKQKPEAEQRQVIPGYISVYSNISMAYQSKFRIFIFCGKDSDEVRDFLNELQSIHNDFNEPITFLSIADRLANDGADLNAEYKNQYFTSQGIFYHHADIITETGKEIKNAIKLLRTQYPIAEYKYHLYDFWPGAAYGKAYNTTRKICRLLGSKATSAATLQTKSNMNDSDSTVVIHENLSVNTARYKFGSSEVLSIYQWLRNQQNPELPSIGIKICDNNEAIIYQKVFYFKDKAIGLTEDLGEHTHKKVIIKRDKDKSNWRSNMLATANKLLKLNNKRKFIFAHGSETFYVRIITEPTDMKARHDCSNLLLKMLNILEYQKQPLERSWIKAYEDRITSNNRCEKENYTYFVLENESGKAIGILSGDIYPNSLGEPEGAIGINAKNLFVEEQYRNLGFAQMLLSKILTVIPKMFGSINIIMTGLSLESKEANNLERYKGYAQKIGLTAVIQDKPAPAKGVYFMVKLENYKYDDAKDMSKAFRQAVAGNHSLDISKPEEKPERKGWHQQKKLSFS